MRIARECVKIVNGVPRRITRLTVHQFELFYEDPGLHVEDKYLAWSDSEAGKWVLAHSVVPPTTHQLQNFDSFSLACRIIAEMYEEDAVYYQLKWNTA